MEESRPAQRMARRFIDPQRSRPRRPFLPTLLLLLLLPLLSLARRLQLLLLLLLLMLLMLLMLPLAFGFAALRPPKVEERAAGRLLVGKSLHPPRVRAALRLTTVRRTAS